jgi:hypothetical protein
MKNLTRIIRFLPTILILSYIAHDLVPHMAAVSAQSADDDIEDIYS